MFENLEDFVVDPAPRSALIKCRVTRDRKGIERGEFKTFKYQLIINVW